MHNSIPCLGYPSRAAAIRALHAEGRTYQQIGEAAGVGSGFISWVIRQGEPNPRPEPRRVHRAKLDPNHIVKGVLPKEVVPLRQPPRASSVARGRTIQAMQSTRYRLQRGDGQYLRLDAGGYVERVEHSWIGFANQLKRLRELRPELADLIAVPVPPPSRGLFNPTAVR